jgi:hypothetical protein
MRRDGSANGNIFGGINIGPDLAFSRAYRGLPLLDEIHLENLLSFGECSLLN